MKRLISLILLLLSACDNSRPLPLKDAGAGEIADLRIPDIGTDARPDMDGGCHWSDPDPGKRCTTNAMCAGGEGCINERCLQLCGGQNNACPMGSRCCSGMGGSGCFPGAECCTSDDCSNGLACLCHQCTQCRVDADCGPGKVCGRGTKRCQLGCASDLDCDGGSVCDPDHVCRKPCTQENDCGNGTHCCGNRCSAAACATTIAGNGMRGPADADAGDAYVGGVVAIAMNTDAGGDHVYFSDTRAGIRVFDRKDNKVRRFAGKRYGCRDGTLEDAEMGEIWGLAFANDGNLYAADGVCHVIWAVDPTKKTVTRLAGGIGQPAEKDGKGDAARFAAPAGLAHHGGALYVADRNGNAIRRVDLAGNVTTVAVKPGTFRAPFALAADGVGNLYVGEYDDSNTSPNLYKLEMGAPINVTIIHSGPQFFGSMAAAPGGGLFASFYYAGVYKLAPNGGGGSWSATPLNLGTGTRSVGIAPTGDALWVGGSQFMNGPNANLLAEFDLAGKPLGTFVGKSQVEGFDPATFVTRCGGGITVDDQGYVWQVDACSYRVLKLDAAGKLLAVYGNGLEMAVSGSATTASFYAPIAITAIKNDVYVADYKGGVSKIAGDLPPSDPNAVMVISRAMNLDGYVNDTWVPSQPAGMVADRAGNLYVSVGTGYRAAQKQWVGQGLIARIENYGKGPAKSFAGMLDKRAASLPDCGALLGTAYQLAIDRTTDTIYVADGVCGVRSVDSTTGKLNPAANFSAVGLSLGPKEGGKQTLFANRGEQIYKFPDIADLGTFQYFAGAPVSYSNHFEDGPVARARFWYPYNLALSAGGDRLFVSDQYNNRLRAIWLK